MKETPRPYMLTCYTKVNKKAGEEPKQVEPTIFAENAEVLIEDVMRYMNTNHDFPVVITVQKNGWIKGEDGIMQEDNEIIASVVVKAKQYKTNYGQQRKQNNESKKNQ